MNRKRLLKAFGIALACVIGMQAVVHGGFWVLMAMPKWMSVSAITLIAIGVCTTFFYKALTYKEDSK